MKRFAFIFLILTVFIFIISSLSIYAIDEKYETIKIGLNYGQNAKQEVKVSSDMGFEAGYMEGNKFVKLFELSESTINAKTIYMVEGISLNSVTYNTQNSNFALMPINEMVNIDGTIYRGGVEFFVNSQGLLNVINFVNINDYVAGVVGKEMSASWPIEALKAQAVCARSFALRSFNKHSSHGFNLCATQDCQVYQGIKGESESTIMASEETKDEILTYNGSVAEALYSSSSGGATAYAKNVWGGDVSYLKGIYDPYDLASDNPRASWKVDLTKEDIKEKLKNASIDIGDVLNFKVTKADENGRSYEVTIFGTKGDYVLKNDKTRSFFNFYSQNYTITGNGADKKEVYAITSPLKTLSLSDYLSLGSKSSSVVGDTLYVISSKGESSIDITPSSYDSFTINGKGWGHGVGMSQYGAKQMALEGFDYKEILDFYYKGTEIS